MKRPHACAALWALIILCTPIQMLCQDTPQTYAHVRNSFSLVVHAPYEKAAPLFGPNGEKGWSEEPWNPEFFYPQPGQDVEGAVFAVKRGETKSIWVNTLFDAGGHRFQYVYVIPDAMVTMIDVRFVPVGRDETRVHVTYTRTALDSSANGHVRAMGEEDGKSGPLWEKAVNEYLKRGGK